MARREETLTLCLDVGYGEMEGKEGKIKRLVIVINLVFRTGQSLKEGS